MTTVGDPNTTTGAPAAPGWHGKLPSLGDFASRRLEPAFLAMWDEWLAEGMQALRSSAPGHWLDAYLQGPSWRFVLLPGALPGAFGDRAWAGVLMPSVDRVGRYFPFTVVQSLGDADALPPLSAVWPWLDRIDELAADALQDDWTVDRVEAELARLPPPTGAPATGRGAAGDDSAPTRSIRTIGLPSGLDAAGWIALEAQRLWIAHERGASFWVAQAERDAAPRLCRVRGLPDAAALAGLLGSDAAAGAAAAAAAATAGATGAATVAAPPPDDGVIASEAVAVGTDPEATARPERARPAPGPR